MLPGLNTIFEKFHSYRSLPQWVGLGYLTAVTSGVAPRTVREGYEVAAHMAKLAVHPVTFSKFLDAIVFSVDDRIDAMTFQEVESLGDIHRGDTPCPFILNPKVLTSDDWKMLHGMDECGLMPLSVSVAFSNLLAEKVYAEKKACYMVETGQETRAGIRGHHLELSRVCCEFVAVATNPLEMKKFLSHTHDLDSEFVMAANPDRAAFGSILQMYDDMQDLIKDLRFEKEKGMVVANTLNADIAVHDGLKSWADFIEHLDEVKRTPAKFVELARMPAVARECWALMVEESIGLAGHVSVKSAREGLIKIMKGLPGPLMSQEHS